MSMTLRPYQATLKTAIYESLRQYQSVLAQLPTGGGKSVVIADIVADAVRLKRGVMVLAHRGELIDQISGKLNVRHQVVRAGDEPSPYYDVHVAMVQTMARRDQPLVDLIIVDEAHHVIAGQYQRIIAECPNAKVIGFTATPERMDGKGLGDVFDDLICGPSVRELIDGGWLCDYTPYSTPLDGLDDVKVTAGDYNRKHLATLMERSVIYGDLTGTWKALAQGKQTIVFAASVKLSEDYCRDYNDAGIRAAHIDGTTDADTRAEIIEQFRRGIITVITNCSLITEGFDVPACGCVQLVRPTRSLALYLQMVGRAMRPHDGTNAIILDHGENILRHGFPDDERQWELATTRKRRPRTVKLDVEPIPLPEATRKELHHDRTVQLVRVEQPDAPPPPQLPPELQELIDIVDKNGYTNSRGKPDYFWAYKRWLERGGQADQQTLRLFAKKAGYHHMWVKHQMGGPRP